jgi:hypothetical protein
MSVMKTSDYVMLCWDSDAHAHSIMRNGIIIIPPHDFKESSRWYYRMHEGTNIKME